MNEPQLDTAAQLTRAHRDICWLILVATDLEYGGKTARSAKRRLEKRLDELMERYDFYGDRRRVEVAEISAKEALVRLQSELGCSAEEVIERASKLYALVESEAANLAKDQA